MNSKPPPKKKVNRQMPDNFARTSKSPGKKMAMKGPDAMKKNAKPPAPMQGVKTQKHDMQELRAGQGKVEGPSPKKPPTQRESEMMNKKKVRKNAKRSRSIGRS
jgi:hypothetical protein